MTHIVLQPPFDRSQLARIASDWFARNHVDLSDAVRWLTRHDSGESMIKSMKMAWKQASLLPVCQWANHIDSVETITHESHGGLSLAIRIGGDQTRLVQQDVPFDHDVLHDCLSYFPVDIPSPLRDIAEACPGLKIDDVGPLASSAYFYRRLGHIAQWIQGREITTEICLEQACIFPDPDVFLMELANNGEGSLYVLPRNESIYFYDCGDLPGLLPCSVSLEEFVNTFFEEPMRILDPYNTGWAEYPVSEEDQYDRHEDNE